MSQLQRNLFKLHSENPREVSKTKKKLVKNQFIENEYATEKHFNDSIRSEDSKKYQKETEKFQPKTTTIVEIYPSTS